MDELHRTADKLATDAKHLEHALDGELSDEAVDLAISIAKRARRTATLLVRLLATQRDENATALKEAQAHGNKQ